MKIRLFIALSFVAQMVLAQSGKHQKIAGTKCSLIPPEGFVAATNFSGFQNIKTGASIMITEMPAPVQTIAESFTAADLKAKGMTLLEKKSIDFNGSKATFVRISQAANGTIYLKQILIFGDPKYTVLVNGVYPEANKGAEAGLKDALLSTIYNASQNDDPAGAARFSVDVSGTEFKLVKYMAGSLLYSADGKIPTEKPTLIVGNSIAKVTIDNSKQYSIDRLKQWPRGEQNVVKEISPITIDNLSGYEIIADGKSKDAKDELVYQTMLFSGDGYYFIILGKAAEDLKGNLERFKKIAKTFKRK